MGADRIVTDLAPPPAEPQDAEPTYSLGAVSRLTGLSEHVLRAWERRYGAVQPLRTPGGTRRYRESDVARLRLLASAVRDGHAIREVAALDDGELVRRTRRTPAAEARPLLAPILAAVERLDAASVERQLGTQLAALGPAAFVREVVAPVLVEVGERWHAGQIPIAAEHMTSAIVRNLLGGCLRGTAASGRVPPVLFTTLPGERHELGALMAAVAALDAGGHPVFLGGDLPIEEIAAAADALGAAAVAVGACYGGALDLPAGIRALRAAVPARVAVWVGGPAAGSLPMPPGTALVADLEELERKVSLLAVGGPGG